MTKIPTLALAALLLVTTEASATRPTKGRPLKTGQTTSYGAAGDTTAGLSRMYNDLGNGVIKDQRTGLFWEKKSDDGSIHDWDNTYTWSTGDPWNFNGTAASVFLATLNTAPCFGGFCDWRLPTITELPTLVDYGNDYPAVPAAFNTGCTAGCTVTTCSCTRSGYYWSSSTYQTFPGGAWNVGFYDGGGTDDYKTSGSYVRAVRSGP
jgi:Protein of unknown function (DUF1566)